MIIWLSYVVVVADVGKTVDTIIWECFFTRTNLGASEKIKNKYFTIVPCMFHKRVLATLQNTHNSTPSHNTQLKPKPHQLNIPYNWIDWNTYKWLIKVSTWLNFKSIISFYKYAKPTYLICYSWSLTHSLVINANSN